MKVKTCYNPGGFERMSSPPLICHFLIYGVQIKMMMTTTTMMMMVVVVVVVMMMMMIMMLMKTMMSQLGDSSFRVLFVTSSSDILRAISGHSYG